MAQHDFAAQLAPQEHQAYVDVFALEGGSLTLPEHLFVTDVDASLKMTVPSMCFLLRHPVAGTLVFDLGLQRDLAAYPQAMHAHIANRQPINVSNDTASSLRAGGVDPEKDIDIVMLSHVHWDHIGTWRDFPNSKFIVGSGTKHILSDGCPPHYPANIFTTDMLPESAWELPPSPSSVLAHASERRTEHEWKRFATFPSTVDLFGDRSVYVIDSPGHLPGHVNLLIRNSPNKWIVLGGDCCHDRRIYTGEKSMALYDDGHGHQRSVHVDTNAAQSTVDYLQRFTKEIDAAKSAGLDLELEVIFAHDLHWRQGNAERFLSVESNR